MKWNVLRYNINARRIEFYDIFTHGGFKKDYECIVCENLSKEEFAEELRSSLMYHFWARSEHEILVEGWPNLEGTAKKVDIYDQVRLNWDAFVDYAYNFELEK